MNCFLRAGRTALRLFFGLVLFAGAKIPFASSVRARSAEDLAFKVTHCHLRAAFFLYGPRDPHYMDGVADHVGGALLAFGATGH